MKLSRDAHGDLSVRLRDAHVNMNAAEAAQLSKALTEFVWQRFEQLEISDFTDYLSATGWQKEKANPNRSIWRHPSNQTVWLPAFREPMDEGTLDIVLQQITQAEGRERYKVMADLVAHAEDRRPEPELSDNNPQPERSTSRLDHLKRPQEDRTPRINGSEM